jgi:hypothetical protein
MWWAVEFLRCIVSPKLWNDDFEELQKRGTKKVAGCKTDESVINHLLMLRASEISFKFIPSLFNSTIIA